MTEGFIKSLLKTAAIVTVMSVVERFIGFIYRIYLSRSLGAEGLGIYQITLSVVGVLVTLSASGIPITVSRLMLKERANNDPLGEADVISAGILTSLLISVPIVVALFVFRDQISFIFADDRCYDVLVLILPGIVLTSVYAVIRGYFWGNRYYFTYSLIELIEEISMVVIGVLLISKATDVFDGAKKAGICVFVSYIITFSLSSLVFVLKCGRLTNPIRKLKPLLISSSPITAMRTLTSLVGSLVAIVIPLRLVFYGATNAQALSDFGEMSGMAMPLLFMPSTFIGSIALVIVPEISDAFYSGRKDELIKNCERALSCCTVIAALIVPVFIGSGVDIGELFYSNQRAGFYLAAAAIIMLPMSVHMITNSLLNSVNKERFTLVNYVIGALLMFLCVYFLPKYIGIYSLALGYLISYVVMGAANLFMLKRECGKSFRFARSLLLSFLSILPSGAFCYLLSSVLSKVTPLIVSIAISAASTVAFSFILLCVFDVINFKALLSLVFVKKSKAKKLSKAENA
ncbi:MAG: oligosaccharide flippase family protein [Clostridia bacterium]|nr:oligosaccharide flippase family protein [Clostridia bacterium]